jgi:polysaccharide deacetylase family protein (PEP-CTERM system associated)
MTAARTLARGAAATAPPSAGRAARGVAWTGGGANAMTVDVEEHFQVSAMTPVVRRADWPRHPSRVEANVDRLLDLFAAHGVSATFFALGWIAERHTGMVRRIVAGGHELASHGYAHVRVNTQSPGAFRADVARTKAILEDAGGVPVRGYRAASFSIDASTPWAHTILAETGHAYSSSVYPIRHDHYGTPTAPRFAYAPLPDSPFREVPLSTIRFMGGRLPCAGGGYFRLLPYAASAWAIDRLTRREGAPCVFYLHPWEVDPDQPRIPDLPARTRFRHYVNLTRTAPRLARLLGRHPWTRLDRAIPGLAEAGG